MIDPNTSVRRSPQVVYRKLSDGRGGVLLRLDSAAYHGLNEVGALIWSLLSGGTTFATLVEDLHSHLDEAPPNLADDVREFLEDVHRRDLVVLEPGPPSVSETGQPAQPGS